MSKRNNRNTGNDAATKTPAGEGRKTNVRTNVYPPVGQMFYNCEKMEGALRMFISQMELPEHLIEMFGGMPAKVDGIRRYDPENFLGDYTYGKGLVTVRLNPDSNIDVRRIEVTGTVAIWVETCGAEYVRGFLACGKKLVYTCRTLTMPEAVKALKAVKDSEITEIEEATNTSPEFVQPLLLEAAAS